MNACRLDFPAPAVDRKFWRILLLSALVHGGLFLLMAWERQQGPRQLPALLATIRMALPEPAVTAVSAAETSPMPASARPQRRLRQETSPRPQPNPRPAPTMSPVAMAEVPSATVSPAISPVAPAALPVSATGASTIQPIAQTTAPVAAVDGAAEALARYRQRLTALLARQQEYPRVAAMRGWEGEVRLRLRVARKGQLIAVALDRSSGHAVLDEHAAAMLADLGNLPPLPDSVEGSEIQVVVPVNYRLNRNT